MIGLRKQLKEKERQIAELQKTVPTMDSENNLQVRLVEISCANTLATRMQDDIQALHELLAEKNQELLKEKEAREEVLRLNIVHIWLNEVLNRQLE